MSQPMQREPVTRGHATVQSAYPPSEETFAGDIMLRLAGGVWEDTDEIRDHLVETAEDIDDYYPDGPASVDDVPEIFDRVLAEYRRVVTDVSYDAAFLTALPELLLSRGIVMSWGDGFDTGEAVEYAAELAEVARVEGYSVRGYAYVHTQDIDRLVMTGHLFVGFGVFGDRDDAAARAIGQEIVDILRAADLPAEWTGSPDARIESQPLLYEFPIDD